MLILYSDMMATGQKWQSQVRNSGEGDKVDVAVNQ